jgi:hypothetical protein
MMSGGWSTLAILCATLGGLPLIALLIVAAPAPTG